MISDEPKPDSKQGDCQQLQGAGRSQNGRNADRRQPQGGRESVAKELGVDEVRAELLPADKVTEVEALLRKPERPARVRGRRYQRRAGAVPCRCGHRDGRAGFSDAAIEAADVVLMDDTPSKIPEAMNIARKTMRIVRQNIIRIADGQGTGADNHRNWHGQHVVCGARRCRAC